MSTTENTPKKRILTGITPTGIPHLGNYVGAIRPAIKSIQNSDDEAFFFLPDYHGIVKCDDPTIMHQAKLTPPLGSLAVSTLSASLFIANPMCQRLPSWLGS